MIQGSKCLNRYWRGRQMETKQRTPDKFTRKIAILAICVPLLGMIIRFCSHSSQLIEPYYFVMCVHSYPTKRVYVAGEDTALDLAGGEVCYDTESNPPLSDDGTCGKDCYFSVAMEECLRFDESFSVHTDADFTKPGIYEVTLCSVVQNGKWEEELSCSFPIEVINPANLE